MSGPRNSKTEKDGARTYTWKGEKFPSVTTIISAGVPKPALVNWAAKTVAEYTVNEWDSIDAVLHPNGKVTAESKAATIDLLKGAHRRYTSHRANVGTLAHDIAECRALGTPLPVLTDDSAPYVPVIDRFIQEWRPEFIASEMTVYSRTHGFAGTLDFIADLPELGFVLGDYKTGKGIYEETALQLAAYRYADFVGMPDGTEVPIPAVDACVAVNLHTDGYQLFPLDVTPSRFRDFLYAKEVARFKSEKGVVLDPLTPPEVTP